MRAGFGGADLAAISKAYERERRRSAHGLDVESLVSAAQSCGFLEGIVVYPLIPVSVDDDSLLVTAIIGPSVVASSTPVQRSEVLPPPHLGGCDALHYALVRICNIGWQLRSDFAKCVRLWGTF